MILVRYQLNYKMAPSFFRGFRLLSTIIRERLILNKSWDETLKKLQGTIQNEAVAQVVVQPIVRTILESQVSVTTSEKSTNTEAEIV